MPNHSLKNGLKVVFIFTLCSGAFGVRFDLDLVPECAVSCFTKIQDSPGCSNITETCVCYNLGMLVDTQDCMMATCGSTAYAAVDAEYYQKQTNYIVTKFCHSAYGIPFSDLPPVPPTHTPTTNHTSAPEPTTPPTTLPSGDTRPPYTGQAILTISDCTKPYLAITTISSTIYGLAIAGCRKDKPECCPNVPSPIPPPNVPTGIFGGPPVTVTKCPADYARHRSFCCPKLATPAVIRDSKQTVCLSNINLPTIYPIPRYLPRREPPLPTVNYLFVAYPTNSSGINIGDCNNCIIKYYGNNTTTIIDILENTEKQSRKREDRNLAIGVVFTFFGTCFGVYLTFAFKRRKLFPWRKLNEVGVLDKNGSGGGEQLTPSTGSERELNSPDSGNGGAVVAVQGGEERLGITRIDS